MLVDDHAIVREGYRTLLQKQPGLRVVAEAADGAEAYRLYKQVKPGLVIMDITMPGLKSSPPGVLVAAVFDVLNGRTALSPDIDHQLALSRLGEEPAATDVLTPREFETLRMLLAEKTTDEIAGILHVSPKTVANTRYMIRSKLGVASDIELVRLAVRQNIVEW
jgi:two-component system invasion response regulator UvrY